MQQQQQCTTASAPDVWQRMRDWLAMAVRLWGESGRRQYELDGLADQVCQYDCLSICRYKYVGLPVCLGMYAYARV